MKKTSKILLICFIILVVLIISVVAYLQLTAMFPLKTAFPSRPETMVLYSVLGEVNQQFGALDYGFTSTTLPTEEEAIGIADSYLIDNGLLPEDAMFISAELVMGFLSSDDNIVREDVIDYSINEDSIFYLNRTLCAHYNLPLQKGGWQDIRIEQMIEWMEYSRKPKKTISMEI